jgi:uncharacterized protein with HEPN domain
MPRDYEVYLEDIRDAIDKVKRYTTGLSRETFENDDKTVDAVVRNLEIIGEACKMIPESVRLAHANIEWKKIAGLRDILAHQYFGVDIEIISARFGNVAAGNPGGVSRFDPSQNSSLHSLWRGNVARTTCANSH